MAKKPVKYIDDMSVKELQAFQLDVVRWAYKSLQFYRKQIRAYERLTRYIKLKGE